MNFSQMSVSLSLLLSNRVPSWRAGVVTPAAREIYLRALHGAGIAPPPRGIES